MHYLAYLLMLAGVRALQFVSYARLRKTADALGNIAYRLFGRRRKIAVSNIRRTLGLKKETAEKMAAESFRNTARLFMEVPYFLNPQTPLPPAQVSGDQYLRESLGRGKGLILITAHLGNWEIGGKIFAQMGIPAAAIARRQKNPYVDRWIMESRRAFGVHTVYRSRQVGENRKIIEHLRANRIVVFIMDQYQAQGVRVPLLGVETRTTTGPYRFAKMSGAPIHPGCIYFRDGMYLAEAFPEIRLVEREDKQEELKVNTARFNEAIGEMIRQHPEQWFWVHERFKDNPAPL